MSLLVSAGVSAEWDQEVSLLANRYPSFKFVPRAPNLELIATKETPLALFESRECDNPVKTWVGTIQPFRPSLAPEELALILADLAADRQVGFYPDGTLAHMPKCRGPHADRGDLLPRRRVTDSYTVELICRKPPGMPLVRAINPLIFPEASILGEDEQPVIKEPFRPGHLFWKHSALCATYAPDRTWAWGEGVLADYLDQVAIWLAKFAIWTETRERLGRGEGRWIGSATTHDAFSVIDRVLTLPPDTGCHCGKAQKYRDCCQQNEALLAYELIFVYVLNTSFDRSHRELNAFRPQYREGVAKALRSDSESLLAGVRKYRLKVHENIDGPATARDLQALLRAIRKYREGADPGTKAPMP